jgi:hypothetical protein
MAVAAAFRFGAWFINPRSFIDPWLYWGAAESTKYFGKMFSGTYYFRRWTLIFPNYIFQHIFDPFVAQLLLRSLLLILILVLSAVIVFQLTNQIISAIITVVILGSSEYLVFNVGQSYNQGTGLVFVLLAVVLLLQTWKTIAMDIPRTVITAFGVGIALGLGFITYQFLAWIYIPLILVSAAGYLFLLRDQKPGRCIFGILLTFVSLGASFFLTIILDLGVGRIWGYRWENLLSYSKRTADGITASGDFSTSLSGYWNNVAFGPGSFGLLLVMASVCYLLISEGPRGGVQRMFGWYTLALATLYLVFPLIASGFSALSWTNTNIYIAVHCLICTALIISQLLCHIWNLRSVLYRLSSRMKLCVLLMFAFTLLSYRSLIFTRNISIHEIYAVAMASIVVALLLRVATQSSDKPIKKLIALLFIVGSLLPVSAVTEKYWSAQFRTGPSWSEQKAFISQLSEDHRRITSLADKANRRIWLYDNRPHGGWSTNISALLGNYSNFFAGYPLEQVSCLQIDWILNSENSTIVVISGGSQETVRALVLNAVGDCAVVKLSLYLVDQRSDTVWFDISRSLVSS